MKEIDRFQSVSLILSQNILFIRRKIMDESLEKDNQSYNLFSYVNYQNSFE